MSVWNYKQPKGRWYQQLILHSTETLKILKEWGVPGENYLQEKQYLLLPKDVCSETEHLASNLIFLAFFVCFNFVLDKPVVLTVYSWIYTQESFLVISGEHMGCWGMKSSQLSAKLMCIITLVPTYDSFIRRKWNLSFFPPVVLFSRTHLVVLKSYL